MCSNRSKTGKPNPIRGKRLLLTAIGLGLMVCCSGCLAQDAPSPAPEPPAAEKVELPGIKIDVKHQRVDVQARVTLDEGLLELIACTPDTKEHEAIVTIDAASIHIHTALLLLGAKNGHPAMVKPANEEQTQWLHLPPRGDPIGVSLVFKDPDDASKWIERPISDFIKRNAEAGEQPEAEGAQAEDPAKIFDTFLFAGSQLIEGPNGERVYAADESGNVVSISTFGDELLCLPSRQSQDNAALTWAVDPTHLPKKGTAVTLRLTLKAPPENEPHD